MPTFPSEAIAILYAYWRAGELTIHKAESIKQIAAIVNWMLLSIAAQMLPERGSAPMTLTMDEMDSLNQLGDICGVSLERGRLFDVELLKQWLPLLLKLLPIILV